MRESTSAGSAGRRDEARLRREMGRRIVRLRESRGLTRAALGALLGVDASRLGKWENGLHAPLLGHQIALSEVLDVSLDELVAGRIPVPPAALPARAEEMIRGVIHILGALVAPPAVDGHVKQVDDSVNLL